MLLFRGDRERSNEGQAGRWPTGQLLFVDVLHHPQCRSGREVGHFNCAIDDVPLQAKKSTHTLQKIARRTSSCR